MVHPRKITVGAILGVGLLGTLIALGQDQPPRPRPVMPPPESDVAPVVAPIASPKPPPAAPPVVPVSRPPAPAPIALPEVPTVTSLPEPKGATPPSEISQTPKTPSVPPTTTAEPTPIASAPVLEPSPKVVVEPPPLPKLPEPKSTLQPVQHLETPKPAAPKPKPVATPSIDLPPTPSPTKVDLPLPMPPMASPPIAVPPPIAPPMLTPSPIEPPAPQAPKVEPEPATPVTPRINTAPPKAWSPTDTTSPPPLPVPVNTPPEVAAPVAETPPIATPPRAVPSTPVSNPGVGTSRFVVQPKPPVESIPTPQPAWVQPKPAAEPPPPVDNGIRRFQRVFPPNAATVSRAPGPMMGTTPAPTPRPIESPRTGGPDLHAPGQDPNLGILTPQITVEKRGPFLHKIGGPLKYQITIRNVGSVAASQVRVEDEIPGAKLLLSTPAPLSQQGDRLVWILPSLRPGEERMFLEELQPIRAGDVVSTTSVHVYATTSFRTRLDGDLPLPPPTASTGSTPPSLMPAPIATTPPTPSAPPNSLPPLSEMPPSASLPTPGGLPSIDGPSLNTPFTPPAPTLLPTPTPTPSPTPSPEPSATPSPGVGAGPGPALLPSPAPNFLPPPKNVPMTVEVKALPLVGIGQKLIFEVIVSNKGTVPLTGMMLYGKLPAGFSHAEGDNIGADLPDLAVGETKVYKMPVTAVTPGKYTVEIRVTAAPNFELVARPIVTIEAPGLSIQQKASNERLTLGRDNEIAIVVANSQATPVTQVHIVDVLPEGLEFVSASDRGLYQANSRTVTWLLDSVPAGSARTIRLRVQPKSIGTFPHEIVARVEDLPEAKSVNVYQVESFSNLHVTVLDRDDPLEQDKQTIYAIRITNQGAGVATNVQASVTLTDGLEFGGFAQAPTAYRMLGKEIVFAPLPRLQPGATATIHLGVRGTIPGDQRLRVQVVSDQSRTPTTREESTRVYREK